MHRITLIVLRNLSILLLVASFNLGGCGNQSSNADPSSQEILAQMNQAYANCTTYQDTGVVTTTFINSTGRTTIQKPFFTAFVSPDRFRFEYKDSLSSTAPPYIIWRDGVEVLSWSIINPGIRTEDSIGTAIARATGVSDGSAATIPPLLLPEIGLRMFYGETQRIDDAVIDGVNCFRILENATGDTVWIDAKTFLIRRIEAQHTFSDFSTETVTTYNPVFNGVVTYEMLAFNPPQ